MPSLCSSPYAVSSERESPGIETRRTRVICFIKEGRHSASHSIVAHELAAHDYCSPGLRAIRAPQLKRGAEAITRHAPYAQGVDVGARVLAQDDSRAEVA